MALSELAYLFVLLPVCHLSLIYVHRKVGTDVLLCVCRFWLLCIYCMCSHFIWNKQRAALLFSWHCSFVRHQPVPQSGLMLYVMLFCLECSRPNAQRLRRLAVVRLQWASGTLDTTSNRFSTEGNHLVSQPSIIYKFMKIVACSLHSNKNNMEKESR